MSSNKIILQISGFIIFFLFWFFLSHIVNQTLYLPSPEKTFYSIFQMFHSPEIFLDIIATIIRVVVAFLPAVIFGIATGFILGTNINLYHASEIIIDYFRSLPSTALLPLFLLIFGITDGARIGTAAFIGFWMMIVSTISGIRHISNTKIKFGVSLKAKKIQLFKEIIFWEILPHIMAGMRITLSVILIIIIITEMTISPKYGLGTQLLSVQQEFKTDYLYGTIFLTGLLGFFLNKILSVIENRLLYRTTQEFRY